ncbi:MAG TPA: type II secretion system minor pseudopilin GspJ [Dokdonella sp.]|uniref:type II secretion system minor pseudopilin GspJ n=1 Tax=Dokdonella sp. TaxID=2291710 RepID=UPI002D7E33EB|nr:type II secretion system minor pseudopilin GspJ [Dokdonella sp.]HET9031388.1 type II secretion system minor pseudopilin GspJ [Dokdonella sp.]
MKRSLIPSRGRRRGFTLIEILVSLVIFAAMAAITWSALSQIARTRSALAAEQDRFAHIVRIMSNLERDLRQAISRPLRGNYGEQVPAVLGTTERIELSRLGFANPRAEPRSNIERVLYDIDNKKLRRGRYAVLDRAAGSMPQWRDMLDQVSDFRLRYLGSDGAWREQWPPRETPIDELPRAIELRLRLDDMGELRRVISLPSTIPRKGVGANGSVDSPVLPVDPMPIIQPTGVGR